MSFTGKLKDLSGPMRLRFVILAPACVFLGFGTAKWTAGDVNIFHFILTMIAAISGHISVNAFNEYYDFKSGLDFKTDKTPFSGGTGTLPARPELARQAFITSWITFAITATIGLYFLYLKGLSLLPLGVLGLFLVYAYTNYLTLNRFLCLVAPGLGFGPVMVMGTNYVLTGGYSITAFLASLVPFFLVSNLLLLNQFPDVRADKSIGRKHFPVEIGRRASSTIYCAFMAAAFLTIIVGVYLHYFPKTALFGMVTLILAVPACIGSFRYAEDIKKLLPIMAMNVIINIATPVLAALGFLLKGFFSGFGGS
jgi:1,4-dihydroxy-2-naphthoate octaprenyltransferase